MPESTKSKSIYCLNVPCWNTLLDAHAIPFTRLSFSCANALLWLWPGALIPFNCNLFASVLQHYITEFIMVFHPSILLLGHSFYVYTDCSKLCSKCLKGVNVQQLVFNSFRKMHYIYFMLYSGICVFMQQVDLLKFLPNTISPFFYYLLPLPQALCFISKHPCRKCLSLVWIQRSSSFRATLLERWDEKRGYWKL